MRFSNGMRPCVLIASTALSWPAAIDARPVTEAFGEAKKTACLPELRAYEAGPKSASIWESHHSPLWIAYDRCIRDWSLRWWETKLGPDWASHMMDEEAPLPASPSQSASPATVARNTAAPEGAVGTTVPPLRPTGTQEDHNPAGEAADCIRVIYTEDFEVEHVSSTQKAAFRNRCSKPVEVVWCTLTSDCRPGYSNLATVPARKDRGFSYEPSVAGSKVAYAACYNGFVQHQGDLSKKLLHACK